MIARRRLPSPTGPSIHTPSASGPRCASESVILAMVGAETGLPSIWTTPVMPHIAGSFLGHPHGKAALLFVESGNREVSLGAPLAHLVCRLPVCVAGTIPIEIEVDVLLEGPRLIPEEFGEVPVDEALHIVLSGWDAEQWNVLPQRHRCLELGQRLA